MGWKDYVFDCFKKEEFYDFTPEEVINSNFVRFPTYDVFHHDVSVNNGPIASATLSLLFRPKVIVEMGVKIGWTSLLLSRLNPQAEVHGVDIAEYLDYKTETLTGLALVKHKVPNFQLHIMNSWDFDMKGKVDLCFIDADHEEEPVWKDSWRAWENRNRDGDWCIAWDDYHPTNQGVVKSVDKFVAEVGYKLQKAWSWYWIGTKEATEAELSKL